MPEATVESAPPGGAAPDDWLLALYRQMVRIRQFEERVAVLYRDSVVPGFVHLSVGQEAVAAGACSALRPDDAIVTTHRGHGHCLAKGGDMVSMFAELMGRETGMCRGRGGSMHLADPEIGIFGANGIVGAGLPIAVGAAFTARRKAQGSIVVAFFGDGAVATGAFHESMNMAAVLRLPVLFVCENNQFSEFSRAEDQHPVAPHERAGAYAMPALTVDGNDVRAIAETMGHEVEAIRSQGGPRMVEAVTYRWRGHYEGDPERYRESEEVALAQGEDPIARLAAELDAGGLGDQRTAIDEQVEAEVDEAVTAARDGDEPAPGTLHHFVTRPRDDVVAQQVDETAEPFRIMDAVREALRYELAQDPGVWVAGIDVGAGGNVFGLTRGLADDFPGRVLDTPISEAAIVGLAVGGAMAGDRPVVEVMYFDFIGTCLDQLLNQAAKLPYMTGGKAAMSLVVRTQFGAGRSSGSQHSQSLEALLAHIPGLTVVMPSTPADTYGLLRTAINDPNPVVFVEHRLMYGKKGPRPPEGYTVPIGKAAVRRAGRDITLVSWSRMVDESLKAAEEVAEEGIDVEVIDLRTIAPLDEQTLLASVGRTSRLLVAHEAVGRHGVGAELAALVADQAFWDLDGPVRRVAPPATPVPYAPSLERVWLPGADDIAATLRDMAAT